MRNFQTDELNDDLQEILDTFSGADGGIKFVRFKALLEEIEKRSLSGDEAAKEIIKIVKRFRRLIDAANNP